MNAVLKIFLSMSFSGGLLILFLLLGKRLLKDKISRQWQYYIWIAVILRLLLPFGPEVNLMGKTYQAVDQAIFQAVPLLPKQQSPLNVPGGNPAPAAEAERHDKNKNSLTDDLTAAHPSENIGMLLINHIWLFWLMAALILLIRKITFYQGFIRYINAGLTPVSDTELLDRLSMAAGQAGIKKPMELCLNPLVSSPMIIGFFHPCIVLPSADIPDKDFSHKVMRSLPDKVNRVSRLWTVFCISVGIIMSFVFQVWQLIAVYIEVFIRTIPIFEPRQLVYLPLAAVTIIVLAIWTYHEIDNESWSS